MKTCILRHKLALTVNVHVYFIQATKSCLDCNVSYCNKCLRLSHPSREPFIRHSLVSPTRCVTCSSHLLIRDVMIDACQMQLGNKFSAKRQEHLVVMSTITVTLLLQCWRHSRFQGREADAADGAAVSSAQSQGFRLLWCVCWIMLHLVCRRASRSPGS